MNYEKHNSLDIGNMDINEIDVHHIDRNKDIKIALEIIMDETLHDQSVNVKLTSLTPKKVFNPVESGSNLQSDEYVEQYEQLTLLHTYGRKHEDFMDNNVQLYVLLRETMRYHIVCCDDLDSTKHYKKDWYTSERELIVISTFHNYWDE